MHDWTLEKITFEWDTRRVRIDLSWDCRQYMLVAEGVIDLNVPQRREWGRSVSVNGVEGPYDLEDGLQEIAIQMQSGDLIRIVASGFQVPAA